ncbi:MAG: PTS system transporter subunit IID [Erysipelotrichaceae bacterium]|nr:MAG: PTS system transporter subunit [Erysipelotrichaceae bacterium]TXT18598.1 MAG: PTS system transporter subunit IID [Erysipelotrichaceae bacterium]
MCFNYESMQAASVVYAVGPSLQKIHSDNPEALAVEENGKAEDIEAASSIRTSLMGPFAGLGDSILMVLPKTIFGAIAAY